MVLLSKGFGASINVEYESERITVVNTDLGLNMCAIILNAYARHDIRQKCTFFEKLTDVINSLHVDHVVMAGDFNCVLDNDMDIISGEKHADNTVSTFNAVLNECDFHDT